MKLKKKTIIFIVIIIVVGCIIALVNRSYIARRLILKEEKIERIVQTDITENVEQEILTATTETGIIVRQYIPEEERIVKVLRADTTGDGQKEILAVAIKPKSNKQDYNDVRIYILQRRKTGEIQKWMFSPMGEVFENIVTEDINKDGKVEIVAFTIGGNIGIIDVFIWDGSVYKRIFNDGAKGGIELKDIDGDKIKEILLKGTPGYGSYTENYIYKWDGKKYYLYKTEEIKT